MKFDEQKIQMTITNMKVRMQYGVPERNFHNSSESMTIQYFNDNFNDCSISMTISVLARLNLKWLELTE